MRIVIQRVSSASVSVEDKIVGQIGRGFLILVGFSRDENPGAIDWMARKTTGLRIFEDEQDKMNLSLTDIAGEALVVSQFTLYADASKGRRPGFSDAADPKTAQPMYEEYCQKLQVAGVLVQKGIFGEHMTVSLVNDGPVTIIIDR